MSQAEVLRAERAARVLAATSAALVRPYDVVGTTTRLLVAASAAVGAAAGGLILRRLGQDRLHLLAVTSHRAEQVELFQVQTEQGPCFDAVETGRPAVAVGAEQIRSRWPGFADSFATAGYRSAAATPLLWHGDAIGALNLFWTGDDESLAEPHDLLQAFADMATLAIVHAGPVPVTTVLRRTKEALDSRMVIEQAKGVLAYRMKVSTAEAFDELLRMAERDGNVVTDTAAAIVRQAAGQDNAVRPPAAEDR